MTDRRPQRLLITGGAGFIGSNLVHHLLHSWGTADASTCCADERRYPRDPSGSLQLLNVDALTYAGDLERLDGVRDAPGHEFVKADICDAPAMDRLVGSFEPDAILHLAAESHVDRSIEDGSSFVRTNVLGTQALLDAARRHDVPRFLQVSTDEVYGSIREGSFAEDDPYDPSSPYSASKAGADLLCLAHHRTYGTPVTITRCTNNYGPRQHAEKLLPKAILNALAGRTVPVYGDGSNVRDWIYVKDHCTGLETALLQPPAGRVYNIGGGSERTNLQLVREVLDVVGKPHDLIQFVADRPGHDFRYSLDCKRIRALGWRPRTDLKEGLRETIAWYQRHAAKVTA